MNFETIFDNIEEKVENSKLNILSIKKHFNDKIKVNKNNMELLMRIINNLENLEDSLEEFKMLCLDTNKEYLNYIEKKQLKDIKINKLVNDTFMPYILFTRMSLMCEE